MTNDEKKLHRVSLFDPAMQSRIENKTIAYIARDMLSGNSNTELLFREIASRGFADRFTHIIAVKKITEGCKALSDSFPGLDIRFTVFDSDEFVKTLATAGYIISDGRLPQYYIKRSGQMHLCLFDQERLLFADDENDAGKTHIFKELSRLVPMTDLMLCANEEVLKIMNERLFIDSFYTGKLIRGAEPAYYRSDVNEAPVPASESHAKYSPEKIAELMERYAPANEGALPQKEKTPVPGEVPDGKTALDNIIGALFFGESSYIEYERSSRPRIAVMAYLGTHTGATSALRNFCDSISKEEYSLTVFAFATISSRLCLTFGSGTRIIQKDDYNFSVTDMEMLAAGSDELSEKRLWKNEILRSLGSDNFDAVLVFGTVNPFRHRFAGWMNTGLRIFAAESEGAVLDDYPDPEMLTELINRTYDKTILLGGSGRRFRHTEKMPSVLWRGRKTARDEQPETVTYNDGQRELLALTPSPMGLKGCTLIPALDKDKDNILCIAADMKDAASLCSLFGEYAEDKPQAQLYLCVLTDDTSGASEQSGKKITVLPDSSIPLILMKECSRFVYPYEGGSGLETAAALLGSGSRAAEPTAGELLLMDGPNDGTFYSEYAPALPEGKLISDAAVFDTPAPDDGLYDSYDREAREMISSLFKN